MHDDIEDCLAAVFYALREEAEQVEFKHVSLGQPVYAIMTITVGQGSDSAVLDSYGCSREGFTLHIQNDSLQASGCLGKTEHYRDKNPDYNK